MTVEFGRCAVHSQRVENPGNPGLQDNVDQMRVETVWLLDEVHRRLHCLARLATVESTFLWEQTRGLDQKEKKFKIGEKSLPLSLSPLVTQKPITGAFGKTNTNKATWGEVGAKQLTTNLPCLEHHNHKQPTCVATRETQLSETTTRRLLVTCEIMAENKKCKQK